MSVSVLLQSVQALAHSHGMYEGGKKDKRRRRLWSVFLPFSFFLRPVVHWSRSSLPAKYVCLYVRHTAFE